MKLNWRHGLLWLIAGVSLATAEGIQFGMTPQEVMQELGRPRSTMAGATREIWIYPDGGRVEFSDGKATSIENLPITELLENQRESATGPGVGPEATPASERDLSDLIEAESMGMLPDDEVMAYPGFDDIEAFDDLGAPEPERSPWHELVSLGLELVVGFLVMIPILKGAFHWSDIHGDWGQMIWPALAAVVSGSVVRAVAYYGMGTSQLFHVDHVISYATLIFVLMKTTHASTMKRAVTVAGVAKIAAIVVWSLLSVLLLQMAFG